MNAESISHGSAWLGWRPRATFPSRERGHDRQDRALARARARVRGRAELELLPPARANVGVAAALARAPAGFALVTVLESPLAPGICRRDPRLGLLRGRARLWTTLARSRGCRGRDRRAGTARLALGRGNARPSRVARRRFRDRWAADARSLSRRRGRCARGKSRLLGRYRPGAGGVRDDRRV